MARRFCSFFVTIGWTFLHAQAPESGKAAIAGTVVNSATGQPISGALVIATVVPQFTPNQTPSLNRQQPLRAVTNASGRFSFEAENPISASLQVSRQGYRSDNNLDTALVFIGDNLTDTTVRLVPQSIVTGRVVDSDGEPLNGMTVEAVRIDIVDGRRQLRDGYANAVTDDRGEYRLWNLAPGSYYVKFMGRSLMRNYYVSNAAFEYSDSAYGLMYYPSALTQETAQVLRIAPGQTVTAPFTAGSRKAYQIRGKIVNGPPQRPFEIRLLRGAEVMPSRGAVNLAAATFQVVDVTPGPYTLQIYTSDGGPLLFGETPVTMGERDFGGVSVTMGSGVEVHGQVQSSGETQGLAFVKAHRLDSSPGAAPEVTALLERDRTGFTLTGLLPGRYEIGAAGFDGYVSSILEGASDVLANGLTIAPGEVPELTVKLMPGGATVLVTVDGAAPLGRKSTGERWSVLLTGRSGSSQSYRAEEGLGNALDFGGLAPGDYTVYAWPESHPLEFRNPAVLSRLSQYGTTFKVGEGESKEVTVKPIPEEALP